jgi:hypothetical protein
VVDGPSARRWYWADDFAGMQQAARRYPPQKPAGELRNYQRTDGQIPHAEDTGRDRVTFRSPWHRFSPRADGAAECLGGGLVELLPVGRGEPAEVEEAPAACDLGDGLGVGAGVEQVGVDPVQAHIA